MKKPLNTSAAVATLVLPFVMWPLVFREVVADFWTSLAVATLILLISALTLNRRIEFRTKYIWVFVGAVSGFLLYGFFYIGFLATRGLEAFAGGVMSVYSLKTGSSTGIIALLLIFPIAPAEEVYWRGLIQKAFTEVLNPTMAFLLSTIAYTLIHLFTLNPPLLITAFIGGLAWGYLYRASGGLIPSIVSHIIFDLLIFVVAPLA